MRASELKENFIGQLNTIISEIGTLEGQISAKRESAVKLKGAIEALDILINNETSDIKEEKTES